MLNGYRAAVAVVVVVAVAVDAAIYAKKCDKISEGQISCADVTTAKRGTILREQNIKMFNYHLSRHCLLLLCSWRLL